MGFSKYTKGMRHIFLALFALLLIPLITSPVLASEKKVVTTELPAQITVNKDYFATGDVVRIGGTVNGDTYAAGGNVDISGNLNGDLLLAGGNIFITGNVKNDVRVAGGNIIFSGAKIGGNVTVLGGQITTDKQTQITGSVTGAGGNITFYGPIEKGMTIAGGDVSVGNTIGGDIMAGVGNLSFLSGSKVNGNVTYWSDNKVSVQDGATIAGRLTQTIPPRETKTTNAAAKGFLGFLVFLRVTDTIALLAIGLILLALLPIYFANSHEYIKTHFWGTMLVGLIGVIVTPVVIFLLMLTIIGIPLALFLMVLYIFVLWFVRIFPILLLGQFTLSKFGNNKNLYWAYIVGLIIYSVLCVIPIIASITFLVTVLSGYGTLIMQKKNYYTALRSKKLI